jgi:hypothetical protein
MDVSFLVIMQATLGNLADVSLTSLLVSASIERLQDVTRHQSAVYSHCEAYAVERKKKGRAFTTMPV